MRSVDRLYRELRIEKYAYLREWSVKRWLLAHWNWVLFELLAVLGLVWHSWRVGVLVRKRTAELERTIEEKRVVQARADMLRERSERLQKATIVGQLSSMIAHELAQPLAAIRNYCEGQKKLLAAEAPERRLFSVTTEGIAHSLDRTTAIVEKVRSYSREGCARQRREP